MAYFMHKGFYAVIMRKSLSLFICTAFMLTGIVPASYAQAVFNLPQPGEMINLSDAFAPVVLKGVSIHPEDPLLFDFIVDNGHTKLAGQALTDETTKLVKYFLAGLAVPEKDLWVNLSPVEKDRIMADDLSHTDVGRDMLAQDYILKQITSTLMYPEKDLGRKFWDEVYKRSYQKFGITDVPVDAFNKVWITPDEATVYQNGNDAFVAGAHLKVMLESDYVALSHQKDIAGAAAQADSDAQELARNVVREVIIPVLEKEVNEGRNFAPLRQVFQSMVLAGWYKNALKESLLNQVYSDTNKVDGIDIAEKDAKQKVYAQYLEAYQKGVYNYIKEEFDQNTQETTPRKYFSGGISQLSIIYKTIKGKLGAEQMRKTGDWLRQQYRLAVKRSEVVPPSSEIKPVQIGRIYGEELLFSTQNYAVRAEAIKKSIAAAAERSATLNFINGQEAFLFAEIPSDAVLPEISFTNVVMVEELAKSGLDVRVQASYGLNGDKGSLTISALPKNNISERVLGKRVNAFRRAARSLGWSAPEGFIVGNANSLFVPSPRQEPASNRTLYLSRLKGEFGAGGISVVEGEKKIHHVIAKHSSFRLANYPQAWKGKDSIILRSGNDGSALRIQTEGNGYQIDRFASVFDTFGEALNDPNKYEELWSDNAEGQEITRLYLHDLMKDIFKIFEKISRVKLNADDPVTILQQLQKIKGWRENIDKVFVNISNDLPEEPALEIPLLKAQEELLFAGANRAEIRLWFDAILNQYLLNNHVFNFDKRFYAEAAALILMTIKADLNGRELKTDEKRALTDSAENFLMRNFMSGRRPLASVPSPATKETAWAFLTALNHSQSSFYRLYNEDYTSVNISFVEPLDRNEFDAMAYLAIDAGLAFLKKGDGYVLFSYLGNDKFQDSLNQLSHTLSNITGQTNDDAETGDLVAKPGSEIVNAVESAALVIKRLCDSPDMGILRFNENSAPQSYVAVTWGESWDTNVPGLLDSVFKRNGIGAQFIGDKLYAYSEKTGVSAKSILEDAFLYIFNILLHMPSDYSEMTFFAKGGPSEVDDRAELFRQSRHKKVWADEKRKKALRGSLRGILARKNPPSDVRHIIDALMRSGIEFDLWWKEGGDKFRADLVGIMNKEIHAANEKKLSHEKMNVGPVVPAREIMASIEGDRVFRLAMKGRLSPLRERIVDSLRWAFLKGDFPPGKVLTVKDIEKLNIGPAEAYKVRVENDLRMIHRTFAANGHSPIIEAATGMLLSPDEARGKLPNGSRLLMLYSRINNLSPVCVLFNDAAQATFENELMKIRIIKNLDTLQEHIAYLNKWKSIIDASVRLMAYYPADFVRTNEAQLKQKLNDDHQRMLIAIDQNYSRKYQALRARFKLDNAESSGASSDLDQSVRRLKVLRNGAAVFAVGTALMGAITDIFNAPMPITDTLFIAGVISFHTSLVLATALGVRKLWDDPDRVGNDADESDGMGSAGDSEKTDASENMDPKKIQGGIDLGQGNYLNVIATDAAGMPQFDPAQIMKLQKDLRGLVPVPVGSPVPVNMRPLLGLDPNSGNESLQVSQWGSVKFEAEQEVLV